MTQTFQYKHGYVHILEDVITFNESKESAEPIDNTAQKNRDRRTNLLIATLLVILVIYNMIRGNYTTLVIFLLMLALYVGWPFVKKIRLSKANEIKLSTIEEIHYETTKRGETSGYFEIIFTNAQGNKRRRVVQMPGFENDGASHINKAKELFLNRSLMENN